MEINDIRNYLEGTANLLAEKVNLLPEPLVNMAKSRRDICDICSFLSENKKYCTECGCDYPDLTYAPMKECPKGYWSAYKKPEDLPKQKMIINIPGNRIYTHYLGLDYDPKNNSDFFNPLEVQILKEKNMNPDEWEIIDVYLGLRERGSAGATSATKASSLIDGYELLIRKKK